MWIMDMALTTSVYGNPNSSATNTDKQMTTEDNDNDNEASNESVYQLTLKHHQIPT